jgi:uncharacterized protein
MSSRVALWSAVCLTIAAMPIAAAGAASRPVGTVSQAGGYFADTSVSIMTEALPATAGSDQDTVGELARSFAAAGLQRILPVRGLGPIANMRDLLHMRGIDMALVDADILAYAAASGDLPGVESRLSAVARLDSKTVYLVATPGVTAVNDLINQRVLVPGADSDSYVTARAMFSLLAIPIELAGTPLEVAIAELSNGRAKALLLTLQDGDETLAALPQNKGLHLVAIPENAAIAKLYERHTLTSKELPTLVPAAGLATLKVSSLLATFNWRPTHARYYPLLQFLKELPGAVERLRAVDTTGYWSALDGRADVPGWPRFEPARSLIAGITPQPSGVTAPRAALTAPASASTKTPVTSSALANPPAVAPSAAKAAPEPAVAVAAPTVKPVVAPAKVSALPAMTIEVAAHPMAVVADPLGASGGLVTELAVASLKGQQVHLDWSSDADGTARGLLDVHGARLGLPYAHPDCQRKQALTPASAKLCDRFVFSKPIFQALQVFFIRHGSDFTFDRDEQVAGRIVCAESDSDVSSLDKEGRRWLHEDMLTLLRRPKLAACLTALDHGDVDAVLADDLAGRAEIERQKLTERIEVVRRPVATLDLCAVADKANTEAVEAIHRLDAGLQGIMADGQFSDIILRRLGQPQLSAAAAP